jgi:hypothetical protein
MYTSASRATISVVVVRVAPSFLPSLLHCSVPLYKDHPPILPFIFLLFILILFYLHQRLVPPGDLSLTLYTRYSLPLLRSRHPLPLLVVHLLERYAFPLLPSTPDLTMVVLRSRNVPLPWTAPRSRGARKPKVEPLVEPEASPEFRMAKKEPCPYSDSEEAPAEPPVTTQSETEKVAEEGKFHPRRRRGSSAPRWTHVKGARALKMKIKAGRITSPVTAATSPTATSPAVTATLAEPHKAHVPVPGEHEKTVKPVTSYEVAVPRRSLRLLLLSTRMEPQYPKKQPEAVSEVNPNPQTDCEGDSHIQRTHRNKLHFVLDSDSPLSSPELSPVIETTHNDLEPMPPLDLGEAAVAVVVPTAADDDIASLEPVVPKALTEDTPTSGDPRSPCTVANTSTSLPPPAALDIVPVADTPFPITSSSAFLPPSSGTSYKLVDVSGGDPVTVTPAQLDSAFHFTFTSSLLPTPSPPSQPTSPPLAPRKPSFTTYARNTPSSPLEHLPAPSLVEQPSWSSDSSHSRVPLLGLPPAAGKAGATTTSTPYALNILANVAVAAAANPDVGSDDLAAMIDPVHTLFPLASACTAPSVRPARDRKPSRKFCEVAEHCKAVKPAPLRERARTAKGKAAQAVSTPPPSTAPSSTANTTAAKSLLAPTRTTPAIPPRKPDESRKRAHTAKENAHSQSKKGPLRKRARTTVAKATPAVKPPPKTRSRKRST